MSEEYTLTRREALQGIVGTAVAAAVQTRAYPEHTGKGKSVHWPEKVLAASRTNEFLENWRFHRGDVSNAEQENFDDSGWRLLDVPHDWSIEDVPQGSDLASEAIWTDGATPLRTGPFDLYQSAGQTATGWTVGGVGWYRKPLMRPTALLRGAKVELRFEGVYMNCDVWVNSIHLGKHPYGYTEFAFDLAPYLKDGQNMIAVRVDNAGRNSRWYSGSGIFRKVWLTISDELCIPAHGVFITTPEVGADRALVNAAITIENNGASEKHVTELARLVDEAGAEVGNTFESVSVAPNQTANARCEIRLAKPHLWSPADPYLYHAEVIIEAQEKIFDYTSLPVGIRVVEMDAVKGLRINGESYKLRGGCVHSDNGPVGSVCVPRAEERKIEILKANGYNAIRTSHNPPSRAFLDACDRLGVMVIDEAFDCWEEAKNPEDYHLYFKDWWQRDLENMIVRDRNHPCVILWSIGNEMKERAEPRGIEIGKALTARAHELDPSRKVTAAICEPYDHPNQTWQDMQPAFTYLDIAGYNYRLDKYESDHTKYPDRVIVGTESYPNRVFQNWQMIEKSSWVIGDFVWTAIDYIGESGLGRTSLRPAQRPGFSGGLATYPWFNSYCGDIDLIGNKKPQSYFRDVVWRRSPIEMAVQRPVPNGLVERPSDWGWSDELRSWTWPGFEGTPLAVRVYTFGDRVRLFLNGAEIDSKQLSDQDAMKAEFSLPYSSGELKAIAYEGQRELGSKVLMTTGAAQKLVLAPDRSKLKASREDLSYVSVTVVDAEGRQVADAVVPVTFSLTGEAEIAAVGNANPKDVESFKQPHCRTFHGQCLVIVRSKGVSGTMQLLAESPGLVGGTVSLDIAS